MSIEELILKDGPITLNISMSANLNGTVIFRIAAPHSKTIMALDRSQAHLLMLYLQEHLDDERDNTFDNYPLEI